MATTYHPYKIALTDGQKKKLKKAYISITAVALRVKPEQIGRGDELLLTATKNSRVKKTAAAGKVQCSVAEICFLHCLVWQDP